MHLESLNMAAIVLGSFRVSAVAALIAGVLILVVPRLLNYIVAIYLIVIGITGLMGTY